MFGLPGINSTHPNVNVMYIWVIVIEKIKATPGEWIAALCRRQYKRACVKYVIINISIRI